MTGMLTAPAPARFQEAAAALPPGARLFAWGARVLYVGPALNLSAHRNALAVLALGLDGPFGDADDPRDPAGLYRERRTVLIPPDTLHHLRIDGGRMAFLYVDPLSRDLERLRAAPDTAIGDILALLQDLDANRQDWPAVRRGLTAILAGPTDVDARIAAALQRLHAEPAARLRLDDLATAAGLSASRFRRLFRAATGVTLRRYRLWIAMGAATRAIARGESLTHAALDAGFSSSAHFSAAFREMFGLEPSRLGKGRLTLEARADG